MTDRITLANMRFEGRHGYYEHERLAAQPFEIDVELVLDLQPAGVSDDLARTIDYQRVHAIARQVVESTTFNLLEAIAETIARDILAEFDVVEVGVRVRTPAVQLGGPLDYAAVENWRRRPTGQPDGSPG